MSETLDPSTVIPEFEPCERIYLTSSDPVEIARGDDAGARGSLLLRNVTSAISCSSAIAKGLSLQLIDEMNAISPSSLVSFAHLSIDPLESVFAFLQAPALAALEKAIRQRGVKMQVNSAYRTIAQQFILFNYGQRHECGIGVVAPPGGSNHQSGLALDIEDEQGWKPFLEAQGWRWFGPNDRPHFDYVGGGTKDIRSLAILAFQKLWNKNNPNDRISEDGAYGPTTGDRLGRSPIDGFGVAAKTTPGSRVLLLQTPLMQGPDVVQVQQALIKAGLSLAGGADGIFGPGTANAVKQFQQRQGLEADGKVGPKTLAALKIT